MKKYKVYDLAEDKETLGYAETMEEARELGRQRFDETDGDCDLYIAEINPETKKYMFTQRRGLTV